jgi:hypothetical protein
VGKFGEWMVLAGEWFFPDCGSITGPLFVLRLRINTNVQGSNRKMAKGGVAAREKGGNKEN